MRRRLVIDTDGGIDDVVALWWAVSRPDVEVSAVVVTWGNVDRGTAAANVQRVLVAADRTDVPVVVGAEGGVGDSPLRGTGHVVHGHDGLGGHASRWSTGDGTLHDEPAIDLLDRLVDEAPGEVDLVTIGPLSTLGRAVATRPDIARGARSLTVMGGTIRRIGNALPLGEANVGLDPDGAALVVQAPWARPPTLVPLDATMQALLEPEDLALAAEGRTPAARFVAGPLTAYADAYRRRGIGAQGTQPCHDLLAVMVAVDPSHLVDAPIAPLAVDTGGSAAWGTTVADLRSSADVEPSAFRPWRLGLRADVDRFRQGFRDLCGA